MILGTVASAIKEEINSLRIDDEAPGMIALALSLARAVDASAKNPAAKATAARELRAVMRELHARAPVGKEGDTVDELQDKREERRKAARERAAAQE
ncbi:hypothetical protein AB0D38_02920 [Streptomyces sp. NPDC048279]|uniref:hypothetical protein n=1 Tax=Streptomyces sp. NPDC048279 TaxID=3154714 RepID=UPI003436DA5D